MAYYTPSPYKQHKGLPISHVRARFGLTPPMLVSHPEATIYISPLLKQHILEVISRIHGILQVAFGQAPFANIEPFNPMSLANQMMEVCRPSLHPKHATIDDVTISSTHRKLALYSQLTWLHRL